MQLSFVPLKISEPMKPLLETLVVGPYTFDLFTHSFLNYGWRQLRQLRCNGCVHMLACVWRCQAWRRRRSCSTV